MSYRGIFYVLIYNVITAIYYVRLKFLLNEVDVFLVLSVSFLVIVGLFLAYNFLRSGTVAFSVLRDSSAHRPLVILNLATTVSWICCFEAIRFIQPVLVFTIIATLVPLFTFLFLTPERQRKSISSYEWICFLIIVSALLFLVRKSVAESTGSTYYVGVGAGLAYITSCSNVFITSEVRKIYKLGYRVEQILPLRFLALLIVSLAMLANSGVSPISDIHATLDIGYAALVGLGLPVLLFHMGVSNTSPAILLLVHGILPLFFLAVQFFEDTMQPSISTVIAVSLATMLAISLMFVRDSHGRHVADPNNDHSAK